MKYIQSIQNLLLCRIDVIVRKTDKSLRLCINYRLLNKKTIRDAYRLRLQFVFERLRKHGLKLKPSKCHFFKRQVKFLGHVISENGVMTDPEKTCTIEEWKVPKSEKGLRSFLGLCSYYRNYVQGFSKIAAPLHALLTKTEKNERKI